MKKIFIPILTLIVLPCFLMAQTAIKAEMIYTVSGAPIKDGIILIKDGKILIGYNDRIAIFGLEKFSLERETNLSSLFYKFIVFEQFEHICVLCETAIVGMSSNGLEIWRVDTDLITDFAISGNSIRLEFSDSPVVEINLYTGKTN